MSVNYIPAYWIEVVSINGLKNPVTNNKTQIAKHEALKRNYCSVCKYIIEINFDTFQGKLSQFETIEKTCENWVPSFVCSKPCKPF